jgi:hypothetical protein
MSCDRGLIGLDLFRLDIDQIILILVIKLAHRAQELLELAPAVLVVSHWEVDSEATVALMDGLFEALKANPRLSHAEALRLSMLRMIANSSKPEWAQPEFWAPFVVVGEPMKLQ